MIVDIRFSESETQIIFKAKDVNKDDLISLTSTIANRYCFEAMGLSCKEFDTFLSQLEPRRKYVIIVGLDDDKGFVGYGALNR